MKRWPVALLLLLMPLTNAVAGTCTSPEHHQLDFWIGDWNVYDVADEKAAAAHVRVAPILDGCALEEFYQDSGGLRGQSLSTYDESRRVWHQTWVTNRGQLLAIEGRKRGEELFFEGSAMPGGVHTLYRATWKPEGVNVRESAETSVDGGKTWKPWFDLRFKPRKR